MSDTTTATAEDNSPMPMIGKGENAEPNFSATTPQRGHRYIYQESGLSKDVADQFVANNLAEAGKKLADIRQGEPKIGTSIAKYNKEMSAWQ